MLHHIADRGPEDDVQELVAKLVLDELVEVSGDESAEEVVEIFDFLELSVQLVDLIFVERAEVLQ